MIIAMRFLSASALVVGQAWTRFLIPVDEGENRISSPVAKVNSGLGISEERFLNVHRQTGLIQASACHYSQNCWHITLICMG
jgi:hypothetical protein